MSSLLAVASLILMTIVPAPAQITALVDSEVPGQVAPYLQPQRLVHVARERTINLVCLGQGSPTVILTAGSGGWSLVWYQIQSSLSRRTRACAWDPAGLGFRSASPEPQDGVHKTHDLEQALKGAHLDGPYVMVAHSSGAYVALTFTDHHRGAVAGMILVDPAIPDEDTVRKRVAPPAFKVALLKRAHQSLTSARLSRCQPPLQTCRCALLD